MNRESRNFTFLYLIYFFAIKKIYLNNGFRGWSNIIQQFRERHMPKLSMRYFCLLEPHNGALSSYHQNTFVWLRLAIRGSLPRKPVQSQLKLSVRVTERKHILTKSQIARKVDQIAHASNYTLNSFIVRGFFWSGFLPFV